MALRFCANLNFLFAESGGNLVDKIRLASKAGFKGIEIGFPSDDILEKVIEVQQEAGIEVVLLNMSVRGGDKVACGPTSVPGEGKQFISNLEESINLAKKLNCGKIHLMSGKIVDSESKENHLKTYIENLKIAAKRLEKENIVGLIEPINKYALPGYFLNSYETAVDVLTEVNSPNLKLMVDVFHLQHIKGNVVNTLNEVKHHIGHFQVAQVPHRHEPNVPGELDYSFVFETIRSIGYSSWVGCEYKPLKGTEEGLGWIPQNGSF